MTADDFAKRVTVIGHQYGRRKNRLAECPACKGPTLYFTNGKSGLVVGCHRDDGSPGCSIETVLDALGLEKIDLLTAWDAWLREQLDSLEPEGGSSGEPAP